MIRISAPNSLAITFAFTSGVSLNTSLFIALNRLKTIMFIRRQSVSILLTTIRNKIHNKFQDDSIFFLISVAISTFLTLPAVLDLCFWTTVRYIPITYNDAVIMVPNNVINNEVDKFSSITQYCFIFRLFEEYRMLLELLLVWPPL